MVKYKFIALILFCALVAVIYILPQKSLSEVVPVVEIQITEEERDLKHRQELWISSLEWCESRGKNSAINKMDRDGTPSYSNFQWKPSTFIYYGTMYGLLATSTTIESVPELLKNYELQRDIVRHMVNDNRVNFYQQFPDCVKLKVGLPPTK